MDLLWSSLSAVSAVCSLLALVVLAKAARILALWMQGFDIEKERIDGDLRTYHDGTHEALRRIEDDLRSVRAEWHGQIDSLNRRIDDVQRYNEAEMKRIRESIESMKSERKP